MSAKGSLVNWRWIENKWKTQHTNVQQKRNKRYLVRSSYWKIIKVWDHNNGFRSLEQIREFKIIFPYTLYKLFYLDTYKIPLLFWICTFFKISTAIFYWYVLIGYKPLIGLCSSEVLRILHILGTHKYFELRN